MKPAAHDFRHRLGCAAADADALTYAVAIQRDVAPAGWPAALELVPPDRRDHATRYLRGMAARLRILRQAKAASSGIAAGSLLYDQRGDGTPVMGGGNGQDPGV